MYRPLCKVTLSAPAADKAATTAATAASANLASPFVLLSLLLKKLSSLLIYFATLH